MCVVCLLVTRTIFSVEGGFPHVSSSTYDAVLSESFTSLFLPTCDSLTFRVLLASPPMRQSPTFFFF